MPPPYNGMAYRVYPIRVFVCVCVFSFIRLCVPELCPNHNFIMHDGI